MLTDGDQVVTEAGAIALYLADRYAYGKLAPAVDDPARGTQPALVVLRAVGDRARRDGEVEGLGGRGPGQVGWGTYDSMLSAMEAAISGRQFILGDEFSMADVVFGGTLRYMLRFNMLEPKPAFTAYSERLAARPALQRADAKNAAVMKAHGLGG